MRVQQDASDRRPGRQPVPSCRHDRVRAYSAASAFSASPSSSMACTSITSMMRRPKSGAVDEVMTGPPIFFSAALRAMPAAVLGEAFRVGRSLDLGRGGFRQRAQS